MNPTQTPNRCRIVLIAPPGADAARILAAVDGGDVASLILPPWSLDEASYQRLADAVVPAAQAHGVATLTVGDPRMAMRSGADGLHVDGARHELEDIIGKHNSRLMIGAGGAKTRDDALALGELRPDYIFFGRFGYDGRPEPHPRNLKLGEWWSEMVALPCVVMAGSDASSAIDVALTGADFVAVSEAVYGDDTDPADAVAKVNALLDERAPPFET